MHALGMGDSGAQVPAAAPLFVPVVQQTERKVADLEVAGAIPAGDSFLAVSSNSRTPDFESGNDGASPSAAATLGKMNRTSVPGPP